MSDHLTPTDIVTKPKLHLFLSPHYDDIALSCGGTARLVALAGRNPQVVLLFGSEPDLSSPLSDFAENMHRDWGLDTTSVVTGRRAEEAAASAILGASDRFLPFHDAIYRGLNYTSNDELFATPAESDALLPARIVDELGLGGLANRDARIYAPLASGNHVDHQIAFKAGVELANAGWDVWFYEDLPYSLRAERREARLDALDGQMTVAALVDVSRVWDDKIEAIMAYPSQLPTIFDYVDIGHSRQQIDEALSTYARSFGPDARVERFWKLG